MLEVSTSEVRCYQACREKHRFRYVLRRRPHKLEAGDPRSLGSAMHKALETGELPDLSDLDPYDAAKVRALFAGYQARYQDDPPPVTREQRFRVDLETCVMVGAIDGVIEDGRAILEHKTSGEDISPGSDYWVTKAVDDQVSNYLLGAESLGYKPEACVYDVVGKPRIKPLKATPVEKQRRTKFGDLYKGQREADETPDEYHDRIIADIAEHPDRYFQRARIVRLDEERKRARSDFLRVVEDIKRTEADKPEPRTIGSCRAYNRLCEYFDVCAGNASINDDGLYRTAEHRHEELNR